KVKGLSSQPLNGNIPNLCTFLRRDSMAPALNSPKRGHNGPPFNGAKFIMQIKTILLSSLAFSAVTAVAVAGPGMWAQLDTNGDGQLTQNELQTAAAAKITAADTDGDGAASAEELKAYFHAKHAEKKAERFAKKDANQDGVLSKD